MVFYYGNRKVANTIYIIHYINIFIYIHTPRDKRFSQLGSTGDKGRKSLGVGHIRQSTNTNCK